MTEITSSQTEIQDSKMDTEETKEEKKETKIDEMDSKYSNPFDIRIPYFMKNYDMHKKYETPHDVPCPSVMGDDVQKAHDVNEWVFNHLPLTEVQKENLEKGLQLDEILAKKRELRNKKRPSKKRKTKVELTDNTFKLERSGVKSS